MTFGLCMMKLSQEKQIEYMSETERHDDDWNDTMMKKNEH